jgi:DNA-binding NtrC family response regulator
MKLSAPMDLMEVVPSNLALNAGTSPLLLIVSETEQAHIAARHILGTSGWRAHSAFDCRQATQLLHSMKFPVILTDCSLPDGDWTTLLEARTAFPLPPQVVVFSRLADHALWAEILNRGAYDLLMYPFHREELARVIALAGALWAREHAQPVPMTPPQRRHLAVSA